MNLQIFKNYIKMEEMCKIKCGLRKTDALKFSTYCIIEFFVNSYSQKSLLNHKLLICFTY